MFSRTHLNETLIPYPCTTLLPLTAISIFKFYPHRCSYTFIIDTAFLPLFIMYLFSSFLQHPLSYTCIYFTIHHLIFLSCLPTMPMIHYNFYKFCLLISQSTPTFSFSLINNLNGILIRYVSYVFYQGHIQES